MKKIYFTLFSVSLLLLASSCSRIEYGSDFDKSREAWLDFKSEYNNTYRYQVTTTSWTGFSTGTVISVDKGRIVRREYEATEMVLDGQGRGPTQNVVGHWIESEGEIGSHTEGAAAVTLDEVYSRAKNEWLKKRDDATVYFKAENRGMISLCGYVPDGCQDDCFHGIHIGYVEPGLSDE